MNKTKSTAVRDAERELATFLTTVERFAQEAEVPLAWTNHGDRSLSRLARTIYNQIQMQRQNVMTLWEHAE